MKKAPTWLLLISMLVLCLAGCGQTAAEPASSAEPAAVASQAAPAAPEAAPEADASAAEAVSAVEAEPEETFDFVKVELPIVTEPVTFSIWYTWPPVLSAFSEGPGTSPFFVELEARTGVHLDCRTINTEAAAEEFSLMAAGGDYTDMIIGGTSYYNSPDQIIEDGIAIDIAPYLDEVMPNLKAILWNNPEYKLAAFTDNGCIPECYRFEIGTDQNVGPVIRKDFLDQLGMDVPLTYDAYHDVLTAFKNDLNVQAPLLLPYTGLTNYYSLGYGVPCDLAQDLFFLIDGEVHYSGMEQDYYDLVELMSQWYAEGLIDPDFLTRTTSTDPDFGLISADNAGVWTANALMFGEYAKSVNNPDFVIEGTSYPRKTEDAGGMYLNETKATGTGYVVTTDCHDVETCLRWIDYWYSEEGTFLANYGIEGQSFVYDENGDPHLTELILESEIGLPSSLTSSIYVVNGGPYIEDCTRNQYFFGDIQHDALALWDRSDWEVLSNAYPEGAKLTPEQSEEYSAIMGDINTYMEETISSVLVGNTPVSELKNIAQNLTDMGIDDAMALKQDAYDRYLSKG